MMSHAVSPDTLDRVESQAASSSAQTNAPGAPANAPVVDVHSADIEPVITGAPNEFDYRPVPIAAPVTLFLGFCSVLGLFTFVGLGLGLFGTLLGAICWYRIRQSAGELGGKWIAVTGGLLSFIFLVCGSSLHAYTIVKEVPKGYQRVNFTHDIAKKPFVTKGDHQTVHPDVAALDGQQIFVKGFMYPEKSTKNLASFLLVKDNQQCCFGGQPQLSDMIMVTMEKGKKFDYHAGLVSVAGTFHTMPTQGPAGLSAIYSIDSAQAEIARTNF